jgi:hypothetical protein
MAAFCGFAQIPPKTHSTETRPLRGLSALLAHLLSRARETRYISYLHGSGAYPVAFRAHDDQEVDHRTDTVLEIESVDSEEGSEHLETLWGGHYCCLLTRVVLLAVRAVLCDGRPIGDLLTA